MLNIGAQHNKDGTVTINTRGPYVTLLTSMADGSYADALTYNMIYRDLSASEYRGLILTHELLHETNSILKDGRGIPNGDNNNKYNQLRIRFSCGGGSDPLPQESGTIATQLFLRP